MKRILWIVFWILTAVMVCSAQTTFYYPHIVNGGTAGVDKWVTTILLTNPGDSTSVASGTITFTKDTTTSFGGDPSTSGLAGTPFSISFTDEVSVITSGTITFSIRGGQIKKYVSSGAGTFTGGFATVSTASGTVQGTAIFSHFNASNGLIAEAGVPSAQAVPRQTIFVDTIGGYNIGVAFANPGSAAGAVTLTLLNAAGATVVPTPFTETLGPGNHDAALTFQKFPTAGPLAGSMQISSTVPLAAIALRFDPNLTLFTTLPSITLASLGSLYPSGLAWLDAHPWLAPLSSVARFLGSLQIGHG